MKKIALFSDGTGNSSASPQKTNVWRAYEVLDTTPASNQIAFYDNGVGTSSFRPSAILGLAFGWGLARNVKRIYGFLCRTYDPGDQIYCFGFSRGAFTIRVAAALIASQGIVDRNIARNERDLDRLIDSAFHRFRRDNFTPSLLSFFLRPVRDVILNTWHHIRGRRLYEPEKNIRFAKDDNEPLIKFVGVWDTVDAYGGPIDELTRAWDRVVWPLSAKDRDLSLRVGRACHALALDEQRESFEPMLWNEHGEKPGTKLEQERLSQVWFPGVHANVGGGYPDDSLAFAPLNWILDESQKDGGLAYLSQVRRLFTDQADINAPIYDNRRGVGNLYRYAPRNLERLGSEKKPGLANTLKSTMGRSDVSTNEVDISKPKIHHSVFDRIRSGGDAYAPINLPKEYALVDARGSVIEIGGTGFPETVDVGDERRRCQSYVWTKVWGRKLLYLITLIAILCFIVYPYVADDPATVAVVLEPWLGTFSFIVRAIPDLIGKIPGFGFAQDWASRYDSFPFEFSIGILVIAGLLIWSLRVNAALKDEMRLSWCRIVGATAAPAPAAGGLRRVLAGFFEGPAYTLEHWGRIALETVAVLILVALVFAACSRIYMSAADGFGAVCGAPAQSRVLGEWIKFDPKDPCFATGLKMEKKRGYVIDLQVFDWKDASIEADVNGWRSPPWYMSLFTPIRRHLFADWYQPVARIGDKLFDRYPLREKPKDGQTVDNDHARNRLRMEFRARKSGDFYLYLNDAVLFKPGALWDFYSNNEGYACVRVTEAPETAEDQTSTQDARCG